MTRHQESLTEANKEALLWLVNQYTKDWPWCRALTPALLEHWETLGAALQRQAIQLVFENGQPQALIHGEHNGLRYHVHLLALLPGSEALGVQLLREAETKARAWSCQELIGPSPRSALFYGGTILGSEPYHPHWSTLSTQAFIQAGFALSCAEVLMVHTLAETVSPEALPMGYSLEETAADKEFQASSFRYAAFKDGKEVAYCAARTYPDFQLPQGGCLAQIGGVATDPKDRNKGLARLLCQHCLLRLKRMGAGEVLISTGLDNGPALKVYERAGFIRKTHLQEWSKKLT